jgi:hypothetical protein
MKDGSRLLDPIPKVEKGFDVATGEPVSKTTTVTHRTPEGGTRTVTTEENAPEPEKEKDMPAKEIKSTDDMVKAAPGQELEHTFADHVRKMSKVQQLAVTKRLPII